MKEIIKNIVAKVLKELNYSIPDFSVDYPRNKKFGDFSANAALVLSKELKKSPRDIASELLPLLEKETVF